MSFITKGNRRFRRSYRVTKHSSLGNVFLICLFLQKELDSHSAHRLNLRAKEYFQDQRRKGRWGDDVDGLIFGWIRDSSVPHYAHTMIWDKNLPESLLQRVGHMELLNADGSEAETSGNGLCCLGQALAREKKVEKLALHITYGNQKRTVTVDRGLYELSKVKTTMAFPEFGGDKENREAKESVLGIAEDAIYVNMGNPHIVARVSDLDAVEIAKHGRLAESFFGPVNVEFIVPGADRKSIEMKVWERGVGVTEACGTGAVASVAACEKWNLVDLGRGMDVTVKMPGGDAVVSWDESEGKALSGTENPSLVPLEYSTKVEYLGKHVF